MRHRLIAAFALLVCGLFAANLFAQSVRFSGTRTLDTGGTGQGPITVSPTTPFPIFEAGSSTGWGFASATGGIASTTTAVTIKTAAGAGIKNVVSSCQISHDVLGAVTEFAIRDGAGGTVIYRTKLQTPATDGFTIVFQSPLIGTANTLLEVVTLTSVTGGVFVNCQGNTTS